MILNIKVKSGSKSQNIGEENGIYFVSLKSRPENNEANMELVKFLKKYFKKEIKIKFGFKSKNKIVEVVE